MNRKSFLRNLVGSVIATAVGSKLDFIPDESLIAGRMVVSKKMLKQFDYTTYVMEDGTRIQFVHNPIFDTPSKFFTEGCSTESCRLIFLDTSQV